MSGRTRCFSANLHARTHHALTTMLQYCQNKTPQVVKPKDVRGASEGSRKMSADTGRSSKATHQQQQPRPPRYNSKTSRSASMPSGYPTSVTGEGSNGSSTSKRAGGGNGNGNGGGGRRYPTSGGGSVSSSMASLQGNGGGGSSRDVSRGMKRGDGWGGGASGGGGGGGSVSSVGSRSGMSDRSR